MSGSCWPLPRVVSCLDQPGNDFSRSRLRGRKSWNTGDERWPTGETEEKDEKGGIYTREDRYDDVKNKLVFNINNNRFRSRRSSKLC